MRTAVTLLAMVLGLVIVAGTFYANRPDSPAEGLSPGSTPPAPTAAEHPATDASEAAAPNPAAAAAASDQQSSPIPNPESKIENAAPPAIAGLHVEPAPAPNTRSIALGSLDPKTALLRVDLTTYGAAIRGIELAHYKDQIDRDLPYVVQEPVLEKDAQGQALDTRYPFASRSITVNGTPIALTLTTPWALVHVSDDATSAAYALRLLDGDNQPVLLITRTYRIAKDSYDIRCDQRFENLTAKPLRIVWEQYGQGDMPLDGGYLGDRRDLVTAWFDPAYDPARNLVFAQDHGYTQRSTVLDKFPGAPGRSTDVKLWPISAAPEKAELIWLAAVNRYFAAVVHLPLEQDQPLASAAIANHFAPPVVEMLGHQTRDRDHRAVIVRLATKPIDIEPNANAAADLALFAGPRKNELFHEAPYHKLGFDQLIRYNLGGPCAFCTFQWLAHFLLSFLKLIHAVTFDWGISIIVLVLVVRAILHPITKKAQINMQRMGKQMQALQPELEKLKKKYKDDQQALNRETMKLYKEKGVNLAGGLGCLPMFLQTPIWIALYAMLYFAIELRHQPAFYNVFQKIGSLWGGNWHFLADLSTADHFIMVFPEPIKLNLLFIHPDFQAINIIPLLMMIVFYFQQKLMTPPPANEQQAQTQRMMKWVTLLFPMFLYSAPSGLTLYILASTGAGIIDSYLVRKHIKKMEADGTLHEPAKGPKPGSLRDRINQAVESKRRQLTEQPRGKRR
jgi:YidC/Oxa1 family membrane protein insertase